MFKQKSHWFVLGQWPDHSGSAQELQENQQHTMSADSQKSRRFPRGIQRHAAKKKKGKQPVGDKTINVPSGAGRTLRQRKQPSERLLGQKEGA